MSTRQKKLTRKKAIKEFCLQCMNGNLHEVGLCVDKKCSLYKFRIKTGRGSRARAIRSQCVECTVSNMATIRKCSFNGECALFDYRMG